MISWFYHVWRYMMDFVLHPLLGLYSLIFTEHIVMTNFIKV